MGRGAGNTTVAAAPRRRATPAKQRKNARARLMRILRPISDYYYQAATRDDKADKNNWVVIPLLSDAARELGSEVHSLQVKQGTALENIAAELIRVHPRHHRPVDLYGPGVEPGTPLPQRSGATYADGERQTVVWSRLPRRQVLALADKIKNEFVDARPSERTFRHLSVLVNDACQQLRAIDPKDYESEPQAYVIDIADEVRDNNGRPRELQLTEMKSSGRLDTGSVRNALGNTLRARLALLDYPCRVKVYAGQAFDSEVSTSFSKAFPKELFKKGKDFWEPLLPEDLSYEDLKSAWSSACSEHRLSANQALLSEAFDGMSREDQEVLLQQLLSKLK